MRRPCIYLSLALLAGCAHERTLSGPEVRELLSGATVEGHQDLHRYPFVRVYETERTFVEHRRGRSARTARWWMRGDRICIRWEDEPRDLCRVIVTDDRGQYWKVMTTRGGRERKIVTYHHFFDPAGHDRRQRVGPAVYLWRWLFGWRGALLLAVLALGAWLLARKLASGREDPDSLRNRLRKRFGRLEAGGESVRYRDLVRGSSEALSRFAVGAVDEQQAVLPAFAFQAMLERTGDALGAWRGMWGCVSHLKDPAAIVALQEVTRGVPDPDPLVEAVRADPRQAYLLGQAYMERAKDATSAQQFERHKATALRFFAKVRENAPTPPHPLVSNAEPYRSAPQTPTDYAALTGPAYESLMYMQFAPLVASAAASSGASSSSFQGGG